MNPQTIKTSNPDSPKVKQFIEEMNSLLEKYQYTIRATIVTATTGIFPALTLVDTVPTKTSPKEDTPIVGSPVRKIIKKETKSA